MISTPDRVKAIELIDEAVSSGARRPKACEELGFNDRTYKRWNSGDTYRRTQGLRPCAKPLQTSLMSKNAKPFLILVISRSIHTCHHRGRSKAPQARHRPTSYCATAPNQVWSWDVSYLPSPVRGQFYYLYVILDIFSRKITGWEVHECESGDYAAALVHKAVLKELCVNQPLVLHADNGAIQKGSTLRAKLEYLGVTSSFSRPRVSNDNPYSESLFRTCKYCPMYPADRFASLEAAREWMSTFVHCYNNEHRHSGIKHVTPAQRHENSDEVLLNKRHALYQEAKLKYPQRWSGNTRNWKRVEEVWLNPENTCSNRDKKAA